MSIISVMKLIRLQNVERFCNLITMYVMSNEAIYEKSMKSILQSMGNYPEVQMNMEMKY